MIGYLVVFGAGLALGKGMGQKPQRALPAPRSISSGPGCVDWRVEDPEVLDLVIQREFADAMLSRQSDPFLITNRVLRQTSSCRLQEATVNNLQAFDLYSQIFAAVTALGTSFWSPEEQVAWSSAFNAWAMEQEERLV